MGCLTWLLHRAENRKTAPELEVRGTGFEPEEDVPGRSLRSLPGLRLPGFDPTLLPCSVRGVGFEPTDPYGTAS